MSTTDDWEDLDEEPCCEECGEGGRILINGVCTECWESDEFWSEATDD